MKGKLANLLKGSDAESQAAKFLLRQGFSIIDKNKSYKFGELDIIAEKGSQRLFIEVKYRRNNHFGTASEFVDLNKQKRLTKAALRWIQEQDPQMLFSYRFDVIAFQGNGNQKQDIDWIKNAFEGLF